MHARYKRRTAAGLRQGQRGSCSSARALAQQATAAPESRAAAEIEGEQEANHGEVHRKQRNKGEKVKR